MSRTVAALVLAGLWFGSGGALAQEASAPSQTAAPEETRAGLIRREQAEKALATAPPTLSRAEKIVNRLEEWGLFTGEPRGVYPLADSVFPGGGIALGGGARRLFGDDGAANVMGAYSLSAFWRAQADVAFPSFADHRGRVSITAGYLDAPDVKYYGVGAGSEVDHKTFFGFTRGGAGGRLDFDVARLLSVGGGVEYFDLDTGSGATGPSLEERFSAADSPGLELTQFRYVKSSARAVVDWRRQPGYSGSGGLYRAQFDDHRETDHAQYSFRSLEAEIDQLIPLVRANWVIALRGQTTLTYVDDDKHIPFFMLPAVGGGETLRGFPDFRFRDRHRMTMTAELRWTPARFLDMAVFYDAGKVAARKRDLHFRDLEDSYGIGMRMIGVKGYAFRVEVARSREHAARLLVSAGGAF